MFRLILGKSGSGKTTEAVQILAELAEKGCDKLMMLVPDQNSFETETAFLDALGPKLCRNVLVFGFDRLGDYVFKNTGNTPRNVIDDGVRRILMSRALDECQDKLEFFSSRKTRKSSLELMIHSLKEWKKNGVNSEMAASAAENIENETLRRKLSETSLVIEAYDALLESAYIDPLDNLNRLKSVLESSTMFSGYTIVVDSFSGFTAVQLEIISILMRRSKDFYITLNIDCEQRHSDVFATTYRTVKAVKRLAKLNGLEAGESVILEGCRRSNKDEISFLEKYVLRVNDVCYEKTTDVIETYEAKNIYDEVEFVSKSIKKLIIEKGYKYSDISVIARSAEPYAGVLDAMFEKYDIPYFMSVPKDIFTKPVARFISCAIEFVARGFERESLLAMLKTGLTALSEVKIADFENYLYIWNINRSALRREFTANPSGFGEFTDKDRTQLAEIEETRKAVIEPMERFQSACKDASALDITKALYGLMTEMKADEAVRSLFDALEANGMLAEGEEEVRVYNLVIEAFEKLNATVGESRIDLKKYREYLEYLFSDIKFSDIPCYQDQVNVGVADRVRLNNEKIVFVIGAVDGVFPSVPKTAGVFTESERRILIQNNIPLTDSPEELADHEKYLAYCALTAPSDKLFVTYFTGDYSGGLYRPSVVYIDILRLFPNAVHRDFDDINQSFELYNERQAFEFLAERFDENSKELLSLKDYFRASPLYGERYEKLERLVKHNPFRINNPENAEKLFGKKLNISASQIEKYNFCAFRYFCTYGLRAKERTRAAIDAIQIGNVVHYCMEHFLRQYNKAALDRLSDEEIIGSVDNIMARFAEENFGGLEGREASFVSLYNRLKENVVILIKYVIYQLSYSDFVPADFELSIGDSGSVPAYTVDLKNGGSVSVRGFIDRVDLCPKADGEYYFRVIDYKTGPKTFTLSEILYGVNMQMLIYLKALAENGEAYYKKKLSPAGVLYMPATAPVVKSDSGNIDAEIAKGFIMNGLVLKDEDVLNKMDKKGSFIKVSRKNLDGEYSDTLASPAQFELIFAHIDDTVRRMGESLLNGNVQAKPLKGIEDGCDYCPYDSVCLWKYGDSRRYATPVNAKEVYEVLGKGDETHE